jgi:RsiW-degrading membrane proteinase PrsW (M82 family)
MITMGGHEMVKRKNREWPFWIVLGAVLVGFGVLLVFWFRFFA